MIRQLLALSSFAISVSGCANWAAVHHGENIPANSAYFVDARQRAIISGSARDRNNNAQQITCAEPSPDAISSIAAAASANLNREDLGDFQASLALSESGAYVGLRTPTIQLLRDGMYRLCETYMNGAISASTYAVLVNRYQQMMIGLVAIEQLTGTVHTQPVSLQGAATVARAQSNIAAQAQANLERFIARRDAADEALQALPATASLPEDQRPANEAERARLQREVGFWGALVTQQTTIAGQLREPPATTATATPVGAPVVGPTVQEPGPSAQEIAAVAEDVRLITASITGSNMADFACIPLFDALTSEIGRLSTQRPTSSFSLFSVLRPSAAAGTSDTATPNTDAEHVAPESNVIDAKLRGQFIDACLRRAISDVQTDRPASANPAPEAPKP